MTIKFLVLKKRGGELLHVLSVFTSLSAFYYEWKLLTISSMHSEDILCVCASSEEQSEEHEEANLIGPMVHLVPQSISHSGQLASFWEAYK